MESGSQRDFGRDDFPPHSRLFIIHEKGTTENEFREAFKAFGGIEDVWIVKDRRTNQDKGVTYIKFRKASQAAQAIEDMNGVTIEGRTKSMKVLLASTKRDGSHRDNNEDDKLLRLFIMVLKDMKEDELKKDFSQFGTVDFVIILRHKKLGDDKCFAYVKFERPYCAAKALEECDPTYKAKFAEPKRQKTAEDYDIYDRDYSGRGMKRDFCDDGPGGYRGGYNDRSPRDRDRRDRDRERRYEPGFGPTGGRDPFSSPMGPSSSYGRGSLDNSFNSPPQVPSVGPVQMIQDYPNAGCQRLQISVPLGLSQNYVTRLFSLIPGLEYCDINESTGTGYARYTSPQCAAYARDKLDGFEYPLGSPIQVQFIGNEAAISPQQSLSHGNNGPYGGISENTLHRAAVALEKAGINPDALLRPEPTNERVPYCSIPLPLVQPMRPDDTHVCQRLFIVCQPSSTPEKILRDAFCRFGNLIDVYLLPGRNYGYAKYATKESAMNAIQVLHGQNLAGNRLKVLEAEAPKQADNDADMEGHDSKRHRH